MTTTTIHDPYSLWPPPVPPPETPEEEVVRQLADYGVTIVAYDLIQDRGLHWCKKLVRLLQFKSRKMPRHRVTWLARYFAGDPLNVDFSEIEPKGKPR